MELKDYQKLTGNKSIVKYEMVVNRSEKEVEVKKSNCLVLASTDSIIALVAEDEPDVIVTIGIGNSPNNVCLSNQLGYPNIWNDETDGNFHCELFASLDEETAVDMMKNSIMIEIERDLSICKTFMDLTSKV